MDDGPTPGAFVRIDSGRCQGHGRCYTLVPELFDADDEGYGTVREPAVTGEGVRLAHAAEMECPERAIFVEDTPA